MVSYFTQQHLLHIADTSVGVTSQGKKFGAPIPGSGDQSDSPVRVISTLEPITDPKSPAMACGPGAAASAKAVAEVKAGGSITYHWRSGVSTIPWGHNWGPIMLYAYQCPDGVDATDCKPPSGDGWTLIDAQAFDPNPNEVPNSNGWTQDRFHHNMSVPSSIPAGLPNGNYLFRHEIIALHRAMDSGAEYYVSCTQVRVSGSSSGSTKSAGAELVAIPGVYNGNEKGIRVNVFDSNLNGGNYVMPGPKRFTAKASGGGDGGAQNPGSSPSPSPSSSDSESTPKPTSSPSPSTCKRRVKKRSMRKHKKSTLRKRHLARAAAVADGIALRGTPKRIVGAQY